MIERKRNKVGRKSEQISEPYLEALYKISGKKQDFSVDFSHLLYCDMIVSHKRWLPAIQTPVESSAGIFQYI